MVFIFLAYFTLYNGLQFQRVEREVGGGIGMGTTCKLKKNNNNTNKKLSDKKKINKKIKLKKKEKKTHWLLSILLHIAIIYGFKIIYIHCFCNSVWLTYFLNVHSLMLQW